MDEPQDDAMVWPELINASELNQFVYCRRAWFLRRRGYHVSAESERRMQQGIRFHEQRAALAKRSQGAQAWQWAVIFILIGMVILIFKALLEQH
jgi:CRISPR/Cas system-associated exonuclease Cas4 (RecB family)